MQKRRLTRFVFYCSLYPCSYCYGNLTRRRMEYSVSQHECCRAKVCANNLHLLKAQTWVRNSLCFHTSCVAVLFSFHSAGLVFIWKKEGKNIAKNGNSSFRCTPLFSYKHSLVFFSIGGVCLCHRATFWSQPSNSHGIYLGCLTWRSNF